MRRVAGLLLVALLAGAGASTAGAAEVSATLTPTGGGMLIANGADGYPGSVWTWQLCSPANVYCTPYAAGQILEIGSQPRGATFKAVSYTGLEARSPVWNGPLHVAAPPSVTGAVSANELVTPVHGAWAGGWTGDFEQTQMSACPTESGVGCITLTSTKFPSNCPNQSAVIDPDFTGWYLRVAAVVYGPDTYFPAIGYSTLYGSWPYFDSPWKAAPTTAVSILSRIGPATGPRIVSCGPPALVPGLPPMVAVGIHAAALARDGSGTVQCFRVCLVELHASAHGRFAEARSSKQGESRLRIPPRALSRLGRGPIRYTLFIDGHVAAHRTT